MRAGSVAVITGASSGIGEAAARAFAQLGYHVVLSARRLDLLTSICDGIRASHCVEAVPVQCDVRRAVDVQRLVDTTVARFGRIDVAVLNAGVGLYARVEDTSEEDFRRLIDTNLLGVQLGIRAIVPVMRRQHYGRIIIVGSVVSKQSWPFHGAYAATKFALVGLTQALRAELSGSGVTASLVLPGSTRTSFFEQAKVGPWSYEPRPIGITQSPEQVAQRIVRSVDKPKPEVITTPLMRPAFVISEALPALPDVARKAFYRVVAWWLSRRSKLSRDGIAETTETIAGQH